MRISDWSSDVCSSDLFGVLFADMAIEDGGLLSRSRVLQPKAEAEIAIVLGKDITSANATAADIYAATDHVVAAIEIVDSRIADWKITFARSEEHTSELQSLMRISYAVFCLKQNKQ